MSVRREYEIAFVGLKPGEHEFNYEVDDKFFASYGPQEFKNCKANVRLVLDKHTSFMLLKFAVGGKCGCNLRPMWQFADHGLMG